ncbi:kynureninase [Pseudidiomarina insulisalsae]|uniref:Kynureninase n=1 Tax=Pseudidiomarina insulisalsae TaxID=575789 RepID=A0A432YCR0_9GAMM|nr:kynureninase [Pseudidiomarina insulisalsae]RUO58788.1 kynureninase [Pseudidiomarina insulisalsae]
MDFEKLAQLDAADPLAHCRAQFVIPADTVYLDGNSLGLLSHATQARVAEVTAGQWGQDGIKSWNKHQWVQLPQRVGEKLAPLIGAAPGQVVCCDSISVNLFKALSAALSLVKQQDEGARPRHQVLSTRDNFPTDLYMVQGLSSIVGSERCELQLADESELLANPQAFITEQTAVVLITEVNFRTGRRLPVAKLIEHAHRVGARVIVDLAHSAGAMPVALDAWQADFAVGCTYKYLNGGPGAPAFIYVAKRHLPAISQPLAGWFGHANPFAFEADYEAAPGIEKMLSGTPAVLAMAAVDAALDSFTGVDLQQLRAKSVQLSELFLDLLESTGCANEFRCISPAQSHERGSQLSFAHDDAYAICQALIDAKIIADFRAPNYLRVGFTPLYTRFTDIGLAVERLAQIMADKSYLAPQFQQRHKVT